MPLRLWLSGAAAFLAATLALAAPTQLVPRQSITAVSQSAVASYKPYSFYASAGYCSASATISWTCGTNCEGNPTFKPLASGGDGVTVQYCECPHRARLFPNADRDVRMTRVRRIRPVATLGRNLESRNAALRDVRITLPSFNVSSTDGSTASLS